MSAEIPDVAGQTTLEEQIAETSTPKISTDTIETVHRHTRRIIITDGPILKTADRRRPPLAFRAEVLSIQWYDGDVPDTIGVSGPRVLSTGRYGTQRLSCRFEIGELPDWLLAVIDEAKTPERRTIGREDG